MIDIEKLCEENDYPDKIKALLYHLGIDSEEDEDFIIKYPVWDNSDVCTVNDTYYYIFTDYDAEDFVQSYQESLEDDIRSEVPEWIRDYIDFEHYWEDAQITLSEATGCDMEEFKYDNEWYYYGEQNV